MTPDQGRFRQPVFLTSLALVAGVVALGLVAPEAFARLAASGLGWATETFGWFFMLSMFGFVLTLVGIAVSRHGDTRLGPPDSVPEFSTYSWIAMLLAAGFGIGLVFYGVAEPISHIIAPPHGLTAPHGPEAAKLALQYAFFNWGISQWATYAIVGLIVGFYQFRLGQPGLVSTVLTPLLGRSAAAPILGGALDVFAVVATVVGVATSLGLGVIQVNGGLAYLYGLPETFPVQAVILVLMSGAFMLSAATGLDKGVKILSTINLTVAFALMAVVLLIGPTLPILNAFTQGIGDMLSGFVSMSLQTEPYTEGNWEAGWTVFYWAWCIAWSPFVGAFIARVSYGRTIREFVIGVLVVPPVLAMAWMGIFGGAAIHLDLATGGDISDAVSQNIATSLFRFLEFFPAAQALSLVAMALIFIFLITSADSAFYILGQLTDRGSERPSLAKRLLWGAMIAAVALTLIGSGGLSALQSASILAALPFILILYAMIWALLRALREDRARQLAALYEANAQTPVGASLEEARRLTEAEDVPGQPISPEVLATNTVD